MPRKGRRPPTATLTRIQAAQALGVGRATLERLVASGRLKPAGRVGKAHVYTPAVVEQLRAKLEDERRGRDSAMSARERKDTALAILTELRIEKERGALVPFDTADAVVAAWQAAVRAAVLRLPTDAIRRGVPREHEALLRELAEDVLAAAARVREADGGHADAEEV